MQFEIYKHKYGRVQFVVTEKIYKGLFIPNCIRKFIWLLVNNIQVTISVTLQYFTRKIEAHRFSSLTKVECSHFWSSKVRCDRLLGRLVGSFLAFYFVVLKNFKIYFFNWYISIHSSSSLCFWPYGFFLYLLCFY